MRAIGIILAGGNNHRIRQLTQDRAACAMPIAGSYRSIDFALSSMSNSHVSKVAVFTQYNAGSLNEHLSSSKWWDFGRKQGGLFIFTPAVTAESNAWYRGTADAMAQNISYLKNSHEPYVIISSGDCVYKIDFNKLLEYHIEKKADITVVCKEMPAEAPVERFGIVKVDPDMRIREFEEKPVVARSNIVSCGIYVIRRRQLIEMIERCTEEDRYDFVRDILIRYKDMKQMSAYMMNEYWSNISSVDDYFRTNMDFLKSEVRQFFFKQYPEIRTKVDDLPPAKFNVGSQVHNSLIAGGSIVNGTVEDSILFRKSYIGNNCYIKNSIILNDVYIGDNTHIENCIVESRGTIRANSYYKGENGVQVVVEHNERYVI